MPRRILPRFLQTLSDRYVSVRCQACDAAGRLADPTPDIIAALSDCLAKDGSAKVRLTALRGKHSESYCYQKNFMVIHTGVSASLCLLHPQNHILALQRLKIRSAQFDGLLLWVVRLLAKEA